MNPNVSLFCDGGVIKHNPSPIGGTWAWCAVSEQEMTHSDSGVITPKDAGMPAISNNLTEMLAVLRGLEQLPADWCGTIYSDSQVTLGRLFKAWKWSNIPGWMHMLYKKQIYRLVHWSEVQHVLLSGHPSKAELAAGVGRTGLPVSQYNVWCDEACTAAGKAVAK